MFSDLSCEIAGHKCIDSADKLFDLFYWTLQVSRCADYIGTYTEEGHLISMAYVTHMEPLDLYNNVEQWEGSYHGSVHPEYRSPKYSGTMLKDTVFYFMTKHDLTYLFTWHRIDNKLATRVVMRNGFEFVDIMKGYRVHKGVPIDYNLFIYRG